MEQLVTAIKKLEKTVCWCHNWLLSLGPHYAEGEEEEAVVDLEEEGDNKDGLEYKTEAPLTASYMTPPSTGGCSEPSPHPLHSPTPEGSNPEDNMALWTAKIEVQIEMFLEEAEEDMELDDLPPLKNVALIPISNPMVPGFVPFTVSTGQCYVPPKSLPWKYIILTKAL